MTESNNKYIEKIENKENILKPFPELMNIDQRIIWYTVIRTNNNKYVSSKALSYYVYPGRPYVETKDKICTHKNDLVNNGYFEERKNCQKCGTLFKSLPKKCPNCQFQILDIDYNLVEDENEKNGKNPHFGLKSRNKAIEEADNLYLSARNSVEEYERTRKAGIKHRILENIIGIQKYNGNLNNQEKILPDLILTSLDGIIKDIKAIKKLWPELFDSLDITIWEEYNRVRKRNSEMLINKILKNIPKEIEKLRLYIDKFIK